MPASLRRRSLRLALGANRKSKPVRWIGQLTVRVSISCVSRRSCVVREKANKRAEKSRTSVRRKRGLRKGKARSRGRQPRERLVPPPNSNEPSFRVVAHYCRAFDHYEKRAKQFDELLGKSMMVRMRDHSVGGPSEYRISSTSIEALRWKSRWKVLSDGMLQPLKRPGRDTLLGPTFWYHLDKVFGIQTAEGSFRKSTRVLREMLGSMQEVARKRSLSRLAAEEERQRPRPWHIWCAFCKVGWTSPTRVTTCSCGRTMVGEKGEKSGRPIRPSPFRTRPGSSRRRGF